MEEKEDFSYGVVPLFQTDKGWEVLVVHQISYRGDDFWILPKGHAESGENGTEAALRELSEETGVSKVNLIAEPTFSISYSFIHEKERINKKVTYFVGICDNQNVKITQPQEIKEIRWVTFAEGKNLLTHKNSVDILNKVSDFMEARE